MTELLYGFDQPVRVLLAGLLVHWQYTDRSCAGRPKPQLNIELDISSYAKFLLHDIVHIIG